MPSLSVYVLCGSTLVMLLLSLAFLRHCRVSRPPIGVFNRSDVLLAVLFITLAHVVYVVLPLWLAVGVFALAVLSALYCTLEPLVRSRVLTWLVSLSVIAVDIGAARILGTQNNGFTLINDVVILLVIIGVSNLWVQSGLTARNAVLFSLLLAIFDLFATALSPLTFTLLARLQNTPLTPVLAWTSNGISLGGGLGDFLLVTVFVLTMEKAFGRTAAILGMLLSLLVIAALLLNDQPWPGMIFLAPLMLGQYLFWHRRCGQERTTWQYVQEEPPAPRQVAQAAVHVRSCSGEGEGRPSEALRPRGGVQPEANRTRQEVLR